MTSERHYAWLVGKTLYTDFFSLISTDFSAVIQRGEVSVSAKTKMLKRKLKPRKPAFLGLPQGTVSVNQKKRRSVYIGNYFQKKDYQNSTDLLKPITDRPCCTAIQDGFSSGFNSHEFTDLLMETFPCIAVRRGGVSV